MDKDEKRRLKKLGKRIIAEQSAELERLMAEVNPAPFGSDQWVANYRQGIQNEHLLEATRPDLIHASQIRADFLVYPQRDALPPELLGVPGYFWECLACGDAVSSLPSRSVKCACGNVSIVIAFRNRIISKPERARHIALQEHVLPESPLSSCYYWECLDCGEKIHAAPEFTLHCECGNIEIIVEPPRRDFTDRQRVRLIKLIGRARRRA